MEIATERQSKLFETIVREYIKTAEPVGSKYLVKNYNLNVSPATVRNDMASLVNQGFLAMDHGSSGRYPTNLGYRFFLNNLIQENDIPIVQEVALKQKIWETRFEFDKMLKEASSVMSEITELLSIVSTDEGHLFASGSHYLLDHPEFLDIDVTRTVLHMSDNHALLHALYNKINKFDDVTVIIGDETEIDNLKPCSVVFSKFNKNGKAGTIGVIGPCRMDYEKVIPAIKATKKLIEEV